MLRFINEERTNILINSLNELLNNYRVRNNSFNLSLLNDNSTNIYSSILETEPYSTEPYSTEPYSTEPYSTCLLYTSDAADDSLRVDLGGRRIIKKNTFQKE